MVKMRICPLHDSVCHVRIGMFRSEQCTAAGCCRFLPDCDIHYIPETGGWDYPNPLVIREIKPRKKYRAKPTKAKAQVCNRRKHRIDYLVNTGRAKRDEITTTLNEALDGMGEL